jgi:hypothetical protein
VKLIAPLSSAEAKNGWSCASVFQMCFHGVIRDFPFVYSLPSHCSLNLFMPEVFARGRENISLTFNLLKPAVTLHTTRFNVKKFYVVPTMCLCVLYGSQNKQQLLPYKTLRDWFL